jgi:hypothetical protein
MNLLDRIAQIEKQFPLDTTHPPVPPVRELQKWQRRKDANLARLNTKMEAERLRRKALRTHTNPL